MINIIILTIETSIIITDLVALLIIESICIYNPRDMYIVLVLTAMYMIMYVIDINTTDYANEQILHMLVLILGLADLLRNIVYMIIALHDRICYEDNQYEPFDIQFTDEVCERFIL